METSQLTEALETIVQRLEEGLQPERIILFGSYASGEPDEGSDVDILIVVSESNEPAHRRAQRAYRCVGAVGVPKDLVVLTQAEFEQQAWTVNSLAQQAMEHGKTLYERRTTRGDREMADQGSA